MRSKRTGVLLALVAVFAMSALTAAAASAAAPEFKPGTKQAFTGTSGALKVEFASTADLTCSKASSTGEITGTSTVGSLVLTLAGCESKESGGCKFQTAGAKNEGEIITNALAGELGEVNTTEAASGVGLLLKPASGTEWATIHGICIPGWKLEGSLAGEIATIKKMGKTDKLVFADHIRDITVKGKAVEPSLKLDGSAVSWEATETLTFGGKEVEIT
jgi:hypothetical protein